MSFFFVKIKLIMCFLFLLIGFCVNSTIELDRIHIAGISEDYKACRQNFSNSLVFFYNLVENKSFLEFLLKKQENEKIIYYLLQLKLTFCILKQQEFLLSSEIRSKFTHKIHWQKFEDFNFLKTNSSNILETFLQENHFDLENKKDPVSILILYMLINSHLLQKMVHTEEKLDIPKVIGDEINKLADEIDKLPLNNTFSRKDLLKKEIDFPYLKSKILLYNREGIKKTQKKTFEHVINIILISKIPVALCTNYIRKGPNK